MENNKFNRQIIRYFILAVIAVLFIIYFSNIMASAADLWVIIKPLISGFVIAYILNILMKKMERIYFPDTKNKFLLQSRRPACLLLSIVMIILILILIVKIVLPQVINTLTAFVTILPGVVEQINQWINANRSYFPEIAERIGQIDFNWDSLIKSVADYAGKGIGSLFSSSINFITIFTSGIFNLFVSLVFAIYLLAGKETLLRQARRLLEAFVKESFRRKLIYTLSVANESFANYITGQFTEALIIGSLCALGMGIFRFPYATTVGVFVGATALIPVVGAYIGAGVGLFLILMVDPLQALLFLLYIIVLQQLENNLIYPRVVGTSVGLPGIIVFTAVIVGGGLMGIVGMIIGVPVAATIYKLLQEETRRRLDK